MFDTHCHLNLSPLHEKLTQTINLAREAGVSHFVIPGIDIATSERGTEIANDYQGVYAAVGIHPTEKLETIDLPKSLFRLEELLEEENVVAIGECGLDYYKNETGSKLQQQFLTSQIRLANKEGLPVILHNRQATEDLLGLLTDNWQTAMLGKVIFHCCEPNRDLLSFATKHEVYIGVCGDVTFDPIKQDFIKQVPLELLLLETDSPFLTPEPVKQTTKFPNSPANLLLVAEKVASIKAVSPEAINEITTKNAKRVFGL